MHAHTQRKLCVIKYYSLHISSVGSHDWVGLEPLDVAELFDTNEAVLYAHCGSYTAKAISTRYAKPTGIYNRYTFSYIIRLTKENASLNTILSLIPVKK